jgi:UDP-N-acetyl-D-glucosamine dehydrogenase
MDKILNQKIAVVGLGYVGLPLSLQFARSGVSVIGLDIDPEKVNALNQGQSYIKHVLAETIAEHVDASRLSASTDFGRVQEVDAVIIVSPIFRSFCRLAGPLLRIFAQARL